MSGPNDFIYLQIYRGALAAGATERASLNAATTGLHDYRKGRFTKATKLIQEKIAEAKKSKE